MTQLSHSLKNRLDAIGEKLLVLREKDRQHKLFGASRHGYVLGPTMSEMQLAAICTPLGLKLPEEYAAFISYVGDGGPGPDYGLYPLAESLRRCGVRDWAADFPYEEAWQPLFGGETWSSLEAAGLLHDHMNTPVPPEQQAAYREWENEYSDSVHTQGTLPISDGGCGHVTLLIVGGTQRGSIWSDSRVSDAGLIPMAQTFLDWYETWLHHALDELKGPS